MFRKYTAFFTLLSVLFLFSPVLHAESPETVKTQADNDVQVASKLMVEANRLVDESNSNREKLQASAGLYVQAGKIFEKTTAVYRSLAPKYASETDIKNSNDAMQYCIRMIGEIKKRI
ncbi:MAG: hypothetical protein HYZ84_06380 [Candidatus Omnitrophica bacterium]|nr:hypothetical protein [Candidatus Omnitrophota bacterium]